MLMLLPWLYASLIVLAYIAFTLWCYRQTLQRWLKPQSLTGVTTLVVYASESGNAQQLAQQLTAQLQQQGEAVRCLSLNELKLETFSSLSQLLLVVSTYGEGEAPENARLFTKRFSAFNLNLSHLKIATLALGDSSYRFFCGYALALHQRFLELGAQSLFEPILVDKLDAKAIYQWQRSLQKQGILAATAELQVPAEVQQELLLLIKRELLNAGSPGAGMYALEFSAPSQLQWQAGDILRLYVDAQQREYSIASVMEEGCIRLLVRDQRHPDGRLGLGSGLLCYQLNIGQSIAASIRVNPAFYTPRADVPLILIGNGTGLAGLRAHLKAREDFSSRNWLIYGERSAEHDQPFYSELLSWAASGHLEQLDLAYSRTHLDDLNSAAGARYYAGYVQHVMRQRLPELKQWLEQGAAIYICGSRIGMAADVEQVLLEGLGEQQLQQLIEQRRYCRDVY